MRVTFKGHGYAKQVYEVLWDDESEKHIADETLITGCDNHCSSQDIIAGAVGQRCHFGGNVDRGAYGAIVTVYID